MTFLDRLRQCQLSRTESRRWNSDYKRAAARAAALASGRTNGDTV